MVWFGLKGSKYTTVTKNSHLLGRYRKTASGQLNREIYISELYEFKYLQNLFKLTLLLLGMIWSK